MKPNGYVNRFLAACLIVGMASGTVVSSAAADGSTHVDSPARFAAPFQESPPTVDSPEPRQSSSGLPQRPPPPLTLHSFWPIFLAFALSWVGIAVYTLTFGRRLESLSKSLTSIESATGGDPI